MSFQQLSFIFLVVMSVGGVFFFFSWLELRSKLKGIRREEEAKQHSIKVYELTVTTHKNHWNKQYKQDEKIKLEADYKEATDVMPEWFEWVDSEDSRVKIKRSDIKSVEICTHNVIEVVNDSDSAE